MQRLLIPRAFEKRCDEATLKSSRVPSPGDTDLGIFIFHPDMENVIAMPAELPIFSLSVFRGIAASISLQRTARIVKRSLTSR